MKKAIAVVFASGVVGSMIGLASGLTRKPGEPHLYAEDRQPETTTKVYEVPAAVFSPAGQDDLETATTMQRFRETKRVITSAAIVYHTIMNCNSVAMQFAMMGGGDPQVLDLWLGLILAVQASEDGSEHPSGLDRPQFMRAILPNLLRRVVY